MIANQSRVSQSKPIKRSATPERWIVYASQLFLATWLMFYLIYGLNAALYFAGAPADGPFLIFNALRRIAAGQVGGRDFVDIHGIGLPYLHYPLFALFGGNTINASELSRQWTSILLFALSLWAFTRGALGRTSRIWIGAAVAVALIELVYPNAPTPGGLDISARSTMPLFAFALLLTSLPDRLKAAITGCCVALAFMFGIEHGVCLVLALLTVFGISLIQSLRVRADRSTLLENTRFCVMCLISAITVAVVLLSLLCGINGAFKAVSFNLQEMPMDQIWLFGAPPMPFIGVWRDFLSWHAILKFAPTYVALLILGSLLIKSWNDPLRIARDWRAVAAIMLVYGVLSGVPLVGFLSKHYVFPLLRVLVLVALLLFAKLVLPSKFQLMARIRVWSRRISPQFAAVCVVVSLAVSLALAASATMRTITLVQSLRIKSAGYSRLLDTHWNTFMTEACRLIDSRRQRSSLSIWSAYSGLLESHYKLFHPAQDYMMHTYGPRQWQRYLNTFRSEDPEFVTTMTSEFSFEEWLENERWQFFETLLDNYQPLASIQHATIWQRTPQAWRTASQDFQPIPPEPGSNSYVLPLASTSDRLGVVRVGYVVSNRWDWIPLLGKTPRYLATIEGSPRQLAISFPPYQSEFDFPVQLPRDRPVRIRFSTTSLFPNNSFQIKEVRAKVFNLTLSHNLLVMPPRR